MIFSRRRGAGRHAKAEELERASRTRDRSVLREELDLVEPGDDEPAPAPLRIGPYDLAEAPPGNRVDLGSLLLPAVEGVQIRLQAAQDGVIQQIELAHGQNLLHLGVFAAPRTDGLWDEVRPEIRASLFSDGVAADETPGRWGTELRARLRTQQGFDELRFIGIDGPRWMVRAVLKGPAAVDPSLAGPLDECLTGLVVRRGEEARPTREPLPLQLPEHMRPAAEGDAPGPAQAEQPPVPAQVPRRKPSPRPRRD